MTPGDLVARVALACTRFDSMRLRLWRAAAWACVPICKMFLLGGLVRFVCDGKNWLSEGLASFFGEEGA
eukprot:2038303-Pleurochrysis_carterae.AAC.1